MVFGDVSFGIYALMPQGWVFMISIILIEAVVICRRLTTKWYDHPIYGRVTISNVVSGLAGFFISLKLNGGWYLVVWLPWVSNNEINISNQTELLGLGILYVAALILTLIIELPLNLFLFKKYPRREIFRSTLSANLISYLFGTIALYSYSFGAV